MPFLLPIRYNRALGAYEALPVFENYEVTLQRSAEVSAAARAAIDTLEMPDKEKTKKRKHSDEEDEDEESIYPDQNYGNADDDVNFDGFKTENNVKPQKSKDRVVENDFEEQMSDDDVGFSSDSDGEEKADKMESSKKLQTQIDEMKSRFAQEAKTEKIDLTASIPVRKAQRKRSSNHAANDSMRPFRSILCTFYAFAILVHTPKHFSKPIHLQISVIKAILFYLFNSIYLTGLVNEFNNLKNF